VQDRNVVVLAGVTVNFIIAKRI